MVTARKLWRSARRTGQIPAATLAEVMDAGTEKFTAQGKAETYTASIDYAARSKYRANVQIKTSEGKEWHWKTFKFGIGEGYQENFPCWQNIFCRQLKGMKFPNWMMSRQQSLKHQAIRSTKCFLAGGCQQKKSAVIVSDTRGWIGYSWILKYVIDEINLGGAWWRYFCIVIAQGTHRAQTREGDIAVRGKGKLQVSYQNTVSARLGLAVEWDPGM